MPLDEHGQGPHEIEEEGDGVADFDGGGLHDASDFRHVEVAGELEDKTGCQPHDFLETPVGQQVIPDADVGQHPTSKGIKGHGGE